jgi:hypothetical protein
MHVRFEDAADGSTLIQVQPKAPALHKPPRGGGSKSKSGLSASWQPQQPAATSAAAASAAAQQHVSSPAALKPLAPNRLVAMAQLGRAAVHSPLHASGPTNQACGLQQQQQQQQLLLQHKPCVEALHDNVSRVYGKAGAGCSPHDVCFLPSILCFLFSVFYVFSFLSFFLLSSVFCLLSSVFCLLSSDFCPLYFVF